MKIAVFLISLCLVLMGGVDRAFAGVHSKSCCYARTFHHEMIQDGKKSNPATSASVKHAAISDDDSLLGADGMEEEESDETVARKFRLAGKYQELISYQSVHDQLNGLFKTAPFLFHLGSEKYIFQRVFRV